MSGYWQVVLSKPFTANDGDNRVLAMAELAGDLYVAAGRYGGGPASATLYRLAQDGCKEWQTVTPPWSPQTSGYGMAMLAFKGYLYVGADAGQLYRTADGVHWDLVSGAWGKIACLVEFNGQAYLSTGSGAIWRSGDGLTWTKAVDLAMLDPRIYDVLSLAVLGNHLYAGAGLSFEAKTTGALGEHTVTLKGIQLWCSADGANWSLFHDMAEPNNPASATLYPEHVHAMAAFQGKLYIGEYHGHGLYRTDGSPNSWDYIAAAVSSSGSVFRLLPHDGALYLGVGHLSSGDPGVNGAPLLYTSVDGAQWSPVPGGPTLTGGRHSVTSLLSHGGRLFVGTCRDSGGLEVLEYGPEIKPDALEPNDTAAAATPIALPASAQQSAKTLANLTLVKGDADYFRITYQEAYPCDSATRSTWEIGAGLYAEAVPSALALHAVDEYCRPLAVKVFDSQGALVDQRVTADALVFACPTQIFPDKTALMAVTSPDGTPRRYSLSASFTPACVTVRGKLLYRFWEFLEPPYPPPPDHDFLEHLGDPFFDRAQFVADAEAYLRAYIDWRAKTAKADLCAALGEIALAAGRVDEADRLLREALAAFRELGIHTREADVLRSLAGVSAQRGLAAEAGGNLEKAAALRLQAKDDRGLAQDRMALAQEHLRRSEPAQARPALREAYELCKALGDVRGQVAGLLIQSEAFLALDRREAAVASLLLAEALAGRAADADAAQQVTRWKAVVAARLGTEDFDRAASAVQGRAEVVWREALLGTG